jgi:hypothetical protein
MDTNKEGEGHPRITRIDANVLLFNGISFSCLFVCFVGRFLNFYYSKSAFVGQRPPGKPSASSPRHDLRCDPPLKSDAPQAGPPRRQMVKTERPANGFTRRTKRRVRRGSVPWPPNVTAVLLFCDRRRGCSGNSGEHRFARRTKPRKGETAIRREPYLFADSPTLGITG